MKRVCLLLLSALAAACASVRGGSAPVAADLAFTHVAVVDVETGSVLPDQTVLIAGNRILAVGPSADVYFPSGTRVIEAEGRYLIPGLWDMHAHTMDDRITRETYLPLYLANGVTGMRNMHADCFEPCDNDRTTLAEVRQWQREIAAGDLLGPRMVAASDVIQAPPRGEPSSVDRPTTADEARVLVHRLKERGVDLLKTYSMLPREAYFALADEARTVGIPFAGHVPLGVRASEASDAGQRSFEHFDGFYEECSAREDELRPELIAAAGEPGSADTWPLLIESFSEEKCSALFARLVRNGTWVVPTLILTETYSRIGDDLWLKDPRLRYVTPEERAYWAQRIRHDAALSPEGFEPARQMNRWQRGVVVTMRDAGIRILAGSDAGMPFVFPGFGLHDELELLVEAGLTSAEALRAATLSAAEYLEASDSLGAVAPGRLADLVLLDANPLEDIRNTQRIRAVVLDGRYFDRPALDEVLAGVETAARESAVRVAPPTGERDADRASILAALERVRPSGTVHFAAGTYLVGPIIRIDTPGITLLGHPDGTVLRGCELDEYEAMERDFIAAFERDGFNADAGILGRCGQFQLTGGNVTVRGFTFEQSRLGLVLGCCEDERVLRSFAGGYRIEENRFRNTGNSIRGWVQAEEPTVIRGNEFTNTFHALSSGGSRIHFVDNRVTVPDPARVPFEAYPGFGITIGAYPAIFDGDARPPIEACVENVIAGNHVEGHPDTVLLIASPGTTCRDNVIRDNTLIATRVPRPAAWRFEDTWPIDDPDDPTFVGLPLWLWGDDGAALPPEFLEEGLSPGRVEGTRVEGNRILGAEGLGIQLINASRNRIVGNTISQIRLRDPFPGNAPGAPTGWKAANGSGIWTSPGSDENEILGNTFEDVAGAAIFLEGDRNRVEIRGAADAVRDLGSGNRVGVSDTVPRGGPGSSVPQARSGATRGPIIDMHLHAAAIRSAAHADSVLAWMDRHGVARAMLLVHDTAGLQWRERTPERFARSVSFPCHEGRYPLMDPCFEEWNGWPDPEWLRREHEAGRLHALGEVLNVYYGIPPTDERLAPYWALAEELDIPVGIHTGRGPPPERRPPGCCPNFDDDHGNPALLEPVLRRHPRMRVWLMHAGGPFLREATALMRAYPTVYADMSILNSVVPVEFEAQSLRAFLDAGLGDRIMLGTDNQPIERILERMDSFDFLDAAQRRAILYDNAARFLRLTADEIARDRARAGATTTR